jgi:ankyrin repeat protein
MVERQPLDADVSNDLPFEPPREVYGLPTAGSPAFPELLAAINVNDADRVWELLQREPDLVRQRLTPRSSLPLTLAAGDCSVDALWVLLEAGAAVSADGNAALFRAAAGECPAAVRLLIAYDADVNGVWKDYGPILLGACECHSVQSARLLLANGADPNARWAGVPAQNASHLATPLGMALGTEVRSDRLRPLVGALLEAGAEFEDGPVMDLHRGDLTLLRERLARDPGLLHATFDLPYGNPPLRHATLLHVAADFGHLDAAELLLDAGADVNSRVNGGPTPVFHAVGSYESFGFPVAQLLLERGADPNAHVDLPEEGHTRALTPLAWVRKASRGRQPPEEQLLLLHGARE